MHNLDVGKYETKRRYAHLIPVIAGIAGALTAALLLFPPWKETLDIPYRLHSQRALGWNWIWFPPAPTSLRASISVDWERLRPGGPCLMGHGRPDLVGNQVLQINRP